MSEALCAVTGSGSPTAGSAEAICTLIAAQPNDPEGWLIRALVGNQGSVFGQQTEFLAHMGNQVLSEDNRMDKTFDALRALLGDSEIGGVLKAKYSWLTPAAAGLHFGLAGFVTSAAWHALKVPDVIGPASAWLSGAAMRRVTALSAWCQTSASVIGAIMEQRPPARTIVARAQVTLHDAMTIFGTRDAAVAPGQYGRATRKWLGELDAMPRSQLPATVALDFVTTDHALDEATKATGTVQGVAAGAKEVRIAVKNLNGATLVMLEAAQLAKVYRDAHRWDAALKGLKAVGAVAAKGGLKAAQVSEQLVGAFSAGRKQVPGQLAILSGLLQLRLYFGGAEKLEKLKAQLKLPGLTDEQKDAIDAAILQTQLGLYDNLFSMTSGFSELMGIGAVLTRPASLLGSGALAVAAIAGGAANVMNAAQNYQKAVAKSKEGDIASQFQYLGVSFLYFTAGASSAAFGVEILVHWVKQRAVLEVGIRGGTAAFGFGFARLGLTLTGWGLLLTVAAVATEGIVGYYDRTKLEGWVENCYFGAEPKWKPVTGNNGPASPSAAAEQEQLAFMHALKEAQASAMAQ